MKHDIDTMTSIIKDAVTFERNRLGEPRPIKPEDFDEWLDNLTNRAYHQGRSTKP